MSFVCVSGEDVRAVSFWYFTVEIQTNKNMFLFFFLFNPQTPQFPPNIASCGPRLRAQGASFPEAPAALWVDVLRSSDPAWRDACGAVGLLLEQAMIQWIDLESVVCVRSIHRLNSQTSGSQAKSRHLCNFDGCGIPTPAIPASVLSILGVLRKTNPCL